MSSKKRKFDEAQLKNHSNPCKKHKPNHNEEMEESDEDDVDLIQDPVPMTLIKTNMENKDIFWECIEETTTIEIEDTIDNEQTPQTINGCNIPKFINKTTKKDENGEIIKCANNNCHLLIGIIREQCMNNIKITNYNKINDIIKKCKICKIKICNECFDKNNKCHSCDIHKNKIGNEECSICGIYIHSDGYSMNQRSKPKKERKCKRCVMWLGALSLI